MTTAKQKVLVVIPAYNEAWNIANLEREFKNADWDIVLVNDASTDKTSSLARKFGRIKVIDLPYNLGIGGCVQTGFKYAVRNKYDIVVQFDADGQHVVAEIPRLIRLIEYGKADVVVGSRFLLDSSETYTSTPSRRVGIRVLNYLAMLLVKQKITDCTSGFRAFNESSFKFLAENYPVDYPEPEAIVLLGKKGFKISEVKTEMRKRLGGKSSIASAGIFYMLKVMLGMVMTSTRSVKQFN